MANKIFWAVAETVVFTGVGFAIIGAMAYGAARGFLGARR